MDVTPVPMGPVAADTTVTIVATSFNYARFLPDLLSGVQAQTFDQWQCIVVDDGSTDGSSSLVERAATEDPRFVLVRKPGGGPAGALAAALPSITGDIVVLVDSDDTLLPNRLCEVVAAFRADPQVGMVIHPLLVVGSDLALIGRMPLRQQMLHGDLRAQMIALGGRVGGMGVTSGMAVRRELLDWLGERSLLPQRGMLPDEFLRRVMPLLTMVAAIPHPLGLRRVHGENISGSSTARLTSFVERALEEQFEIFRLQNAVLRALGSTLQFRSEHDLDLLTLTYARARLTGSGARTALRSLRSAPTFRSLGGAQRWFWTVAPWAPRRLFAALLAALLSPNGVKPLVNHLRFRLIARLGDATQGDLLGTAEVLRRALRRHW